MIKRQTFNYHTHTYRCGHAIGTEEEYIQAAIQSGFSTIGISEHMGYYGWDDEKERIPYAQLDDYINTVEKLKEKYKEIINVRVGFECEYFDDSYEHLKEMRDKCDYLICGQHAPDRTNVYYDQAPYYEDKYIWKMAKQICIGVEKGLFKYVAHPDYFMQSKCDFTEEKAKAIKEIAQCVKDYDGVIEINLKGTYYGRMDYSLTNSYRKEIGESYLYPNKAVYQIIGEVGTKVCFGYDAHTPNALLNRELEDSVRKEFEVFGLNMIEDLYL